MNALERWKSGLAAWAIPEEILTAAPESPWGFPADLFERRTTSALRRPLSESHRRSLEALPAGGTMLDVGVGGGAGSLPLASHLSRITGVDTSEKMLESFRKAAADAQVEAVTVLGEWPAVAEQVPSSDVAVCHHVLFNVPDLEPFVVALSSRAQRRVVVEMTPEHPLSWMNDLWLTFHGLERPSVPTYEDAAEAIGNLGFDVRSMLSEGPPVMGGFTYRNDAVAFVRKRLCLWPEDDERLAAALGERLVEKGGIWSATPPSHPLVTLWWDQSGGKPPDHPPKP
jgi:SAM-dependent methyltransferase